MSLPFQKLPFLVIQVILQTMGFLDLFILTCTSAKTKRIVKNVFKIRNHCLSFFISNPLVFKIASRTGKVYSEEIHLHPKEKQVDNAFHVNIGATNSAPFSYEEYDDNTFALSTYWDNPKIGFDVIYDALFEVFGATIEQVTLDVDDVPAKNYQHVIYWIEYQFPTLPSFHVVGECSFEDYIFLIKSIRAKNAVMLFLEPSEHLENSDIINLEMEEIRIEHGYWMTLDRIQAIKARTICIKDTSLTDEEINMLLKNMDAFKERSNLKKLVLDFHSEADPDVLLEGLNVTDEESIKPEDCINQWSFKLANGEKCTIIYCEYETRPADFEHFELEFRIGN